MKRLLKILSLMLLVFIISGATTKTAALLDEVVVEEERTVTLYSLDGREEVVKESDVEAQLTVGWYLEPVTVLYSKDGRAEVTPVSKVEEQKTVGWYEQPININYSAFEKTNIPAYCLDKMLAGSPLQGCGIYFYNMEQTYGVNSVFAIAVTEVESSIGRHNANTNNFWGRKSTNGGWMRWDSKEESIMDFGRYMNRVYPGRSIEQIGPKYCPSPAGWAGKVKTCMTRRYNMF